jgi:hypothetical protein
MKTRRTRRTPEGENLGSSGEWSAWEAIEGHPHTPLETLLQPRSVLLASMVIVGLLALLYLHMASEVTLANNQLQSERAEQLQLVRQDQQLHLQLGQATSPAYIAHAAQAMGLSPSLPLPAPAVTHSVPTRVPPAAEIRP